MDDGERPGERPDLAPGARRQPGWASAASGASLTAAPAGALAVGAAEAREATLLPAWSATRDSAPLGPIAWLRARLADPPIRADRSRELNAERGGRLDRLDVWVLALLAVSLLTVRMWRLDEPYSMHFDEVYHPRTATEFLQDWRYGLPHSIYEWTHPHMAKYAMALGLVAFGEDRVTATGQLGAWPSPRPRSSGAATTASTARRSRATGSGSPPAARSGPTTWRPASSPASSSCPTRSRSPTTSAGTSCTSAPAGARSGSSTPSSSIRIASAASSSWSRGPSCRSSPVSIACSSPVTANACSRCSSRAPARRIRRPRRSCSWTRRPRRRSPESSSPASPR